MTSEMLQQLEGDSLSDEEWEIWYLDMFDRECPPSIEVQGKGLVRGLMELWARYLLETVRPEGWLGFSRFYLRRLDAPSVEIKGELSGAQRLREWIAGNNLKSGRILMERGELRLLRQIAIAHVALLQVGRDASEILSAATEAADHTTFERQLHKLLSSL